MANTTNDGFYAIQDCNGFASVYARDIPGAGGSWFATREAAQAACDAWNEREGDRNRDAYERNHGDDPWLIYYDAANAAWDILEDEGEIGALGSNWQLATRRSAAEFERKMMAEEGWTRTHHTAPRY